MPLTTVVKQQTQHGMKKNSSSGERPSLGKRKTDNFSKFYNKKRNSAVKEAFRQEKKAEKKERKEAIERRFGSIAKSMEKEQLTRIVFSELSVSGKSLECHCENGFKALQSRLDTLCGDKVWISEAVQFDNSIKTSIEALKILLSQKATGP